jgi:tetratricopeptide (TPR) repeat protein
VSRNRKVSCPLRLAIRTSRHIEHVCDVLRTTGGICFWTGRLAPIGVFLYVVIGITSSGARAASHYETELLFFEGQYDECQSIAQLEVDRGVWNELWPELLIRCLLTRGEYERAHAVYEQGLRRYADRIAYRLLGETVYRYVNRPEQADEQLAAILENVRRAPWRYGSSRDQVTLGRYFQRQGEDGRQILELIYDRVRQQNPNYSEVYIATAELALAKHDYALAAEQLKVAAELQPSNPDIFYLQTLAWREDDAQLASEALEHALELNPRHVPSLLLQVDHLIDAEQYALAGELLEKVLEVNLREPKAWAYHAVIAHLQGHFAGEQALRQAALSSWNTNHEVDYLIGRKLSQKYRFREAVAYQRLALQQRADYLPAKFQLAHDLLRLGDEQEGWQLADEVQKQDNYHVVAYNLVTLKEQLDRFRTLTSANFVVRMEAREAAIYGPQVLDLLEAAHAELCPKYEVELAGPTYVEIFPRQQDFAIRTFGLPGGIGYLGVCFGQLITANSPASPGATPTNWHSVLWHEFCHVVTLQKTQNRMPRWLSEGISVYEERQRDPSWGQAMTPGYRQMILGGQLTPVSRLSGAFLRPPTPQHLQFAYYESSLVVEYLIERLGMDTLRRILDDLAVGMPINDALARYTGSTDGLDAEFAAYAKQRAEQTASDLDWNPDRLPDGAPRELVTALLDEHPNNYWLLMAAAREAIRAAEWDEARRLLEQVHAAYPQDTAADGAARMLAQVYRQLEDTAAERRVLETLAQYDSDALDAYRRLIELAEAEGNWSQVRDYAQRIIAVNPLITAAQEQLAAAAQQLNDPRALIDAQAALLESDPADPALGYFRLALAQEQLGDLSQAKRYVLMALEEAPRYREAQRMLLRLVDTSAAEAASSPATPEAVEESAETPPSGLADPSPPAEPPAAQLPSNPSEPKD